jgi:hypothetical protein
MSTTEEAMLYMRMLFVFMTAIDGEMLLFVDLLN